MKLASSLKVPIDEATFTFLPAGYDYFVIISKIEELDFVGKIDLCLNKLIAVEGVTTEEGAVVTLEQIKAKEPFIPGDFYTQLLRKWLDALHGNIKKSREAEAGNESTPGLSGSSKPDSTTT